MQITIENCNSISSGHIHIESGRLNIKYAINGSGKSTIARALNAKVSDESLAEFRPFKFLNDEVEFHNPNVIISEQINKVNIFDEKYIENYIYKKSELVENSFEIFVKTPRYEEHIQQIATLTSSIQTAFQNDPDLERLISDLTIFIESFGNTQNGYSRTSELAKSIGKGNKVDNVPEELELYARYIQSREINLKWLKWQAEGNKYLDVTEKCPYCVSTISTPIDTIIKVSQEYDTKYLSGLLKILDVFSSLSSYFTEETRNSVESIATNATGITDEQVEFLKRLRSEVSAFRDKLNSLRYLGFNSLKDTPNIQELLEQQRIELLYYPQLHCEYTNSKINRMNESLGEVISLAGRLQGQIVQQKQLIRETIERHSKEINGFLDSAGYQYNVSIVEQPDGGDYRLILTYTGQIVSDVKKHLSFGEKNALALVLFMYQTLKENADFIILDDPISSFDNNKKFAIMSMLFRGRRSLAGKTVLMLTHDFDPIINILCVLPRIFNPAARAFFLANVNGNLEEKAITRSDVKSCVSICNSNIESSVDIIHKLIFYRRLLEMQDIKDIAWDLISNIFHKNRDVPVIKQGQDPERHMTQVEIEEATAIVRQKIPEFDYHTTYDRTKNIPDMITLYRSSISGYEKVQIYRILRDGEMTTGDIMKKYVDETFHVQNDYLFQLNPREYKVVPQYILDYCDSGIEDLARAINP